MGTDDIFKRRRAERQARKIGEKPSKANSYLIVTEGERTEPLYLNGLKNKIVSTLGGNVDVIEVPEIKIHGEGRATNSLIDKTIEIVNRSKKMYQHVWVVFDKDDFEDFDDAIKRGVQLGYNVAWNNQCFEYWAYLHFQYSDSALHRDNWREKLSELFKMYDLGNGKYLKNDENIYNILDTYNGVETAIKNAKRRMSEYDDKRDKPSVFDPGTTMHILVEELTGYLKE